MSHHDKTLTERGVENQTEGKIDNLKGRAKDAWGSISGDKSLEAEGKLDRVKGRLQDEWGEAQREVDEDRDRRPR